jgi:hypothetical protein
MKIFNLDLHISVIADIQQIFENLGHQVTSWNMSGHNWVFNRSPAKIDVISTDELNPSHWSFINQEMCDRFYNRYKEELSCYDAFLVTYPPSFSLLFEKWEKPIIIVAPIRYELPFSNRKDDWLKFNEFIKNGVDSGKIKLVGNNKFDCEYGKYFTDREWTHIPSLCEYTGVKYNPSIDKFLYYSRLDYSKCLGGNAIPNLIDKYSALGSNYKWENLVKYKGVVGVPYCPSTMSIFEFYTQNMPLFFPSLSLMKTLRQNYPEKVICESSWNQTWNMPSGSIIRSGENDPNDFANIDIFMRWIKLADFYDSEWMPYIQYFDKWETLRDDLARMNVDDFSNISNNMNEYNKIRKQKVYEKWIALLESIK